MAKKKEDDVVIPPNHDNNDPSIDPRGKGRALPVNKEELRQVAQEKLPDSIIVIGYLEHQLDLIAQLVVDLAESQTLSTEAQDRLDKLKAVLEYSSIDFAHIADKFESYKLPNATELKKHTRKVQKQYLTAQMREGVFGE